MEKQAQIKLKVRRWKEINETDRNFNGTRSWFFQKINKIDKHLSISGLLNLSTADILGQVILSCRGLSNTL
jgi:hypothetical protein